jgi:hypothetical protein
VQLKIEPPRKIYRREVRAQWLDPDGFGRDDRLRPAVPLFNAAANARECVIQARRQITLVTWPAALLPADIR